jgi:hypothetical protein
MPFKEHLRQRTESTLGSHGSTVATRNAASMRFYNSYLPIVLAHIHNLSHLPPKLKRKRAFTNLRSCLGRNSWQTKRVTASADVSAPQGPSPSILGTAPTSIGRRGPFPTGSPDPLRCHPPLPTWKPRTSRSYKKRRGIAFTRQEKKLIEKILPAIMEESDGSHARKASDLPIYELEAPSQVSLSNTLMHELEGSTSRDDLVDVGKSVHELEATTSCRDPTDVSLPSIVVSDFEPIMESNRRLTEENQHMSAFIQELVTKEIVLNEQLARVQKELKALESALKLLWKLVKTSVDGYEKVDTPLQIIQFLSSRELVDILREVDSGQQGQGNN